MIPESDCCLGWLQSSQFHGKPVSEKQISKHWAYYQTIEIQYMRWNSDLPKSFTSSFREFNSIKNSAALFSLYYSRTSYFLSGERSISHTLETHKLLNSCQVFIYKIIYVWRHLDLWWAGMLSNWYAGVLLIWLQECLPAPLLLNHPPHNGAEPSGRSSGNLQRDQPRQCMPADAQRRASFAWKAHAPTKDNWRFPPPECGKHRPYESWAGRHWMSLFGKV